MIIKLYQFESEDIRIDVEARFEGEKLVVEGYDIGRTVAEYWGDSDYEYSVTVYPPAVTKLYPLFELKEGEKSNLLEAIANRFHTNSCFSEFRKFLDDHKIPCEGFSWR